jgi:DNA polymerase I-like protein with 3'-5' exonuclease and polymerase domains
MYVLGKNEYKRMEKEKEIQDGKYIPTIFEKQLNFYLKKRKDISKFFRLKSQYQRLCLNNPVQTTGAHQLKKAKILLFNWIVKNKYQDKILICNSPHDEIILETVNENLAHLAKEKLEECMLKGGNHYLKKLKIKAAANIGQSWAEAK